MPDISLTDDLGQSAPNVKIDLKQPSSLMKYAKSEALHLLVVPDFTAHAAQPLSIAAPNPISFELKLGNKFQLGGAKPEIDLTAGVKSFILADATPGPDHTGYVTLGLEGSLSLGISGSTGGLSFGFNSSSSLAMEYRKAFPLGAGEPSLGAATGQTISTFVLPADMDDLARLGINDVCTVTGQGSLTISGGFKVSATPNPLASVSLPMNAGTLQVTAGAMAGITASYSINGSYQIRARRISANAIELSFCKHQGSTLKTGLSVSGGVAVKFNGTDLLKSLLGAISTDPDDDATKKLFADGGLSADEISTLNTAIKSSLDHSLQASLDLALSRVEDGQAAFQYEIQPALLDAAASTAVHRALQGDLSLLNNLENQSEGQTIAPGVKLTSSIVTKTQTAGVALTVNLLGLVNFGSISSMLMKSVVVKDPVTGNLTIADTTTGTQINSQIDDLHRGETLHKAMFESLMITATYRVSKAVQMTGLASHNFHFAFNRNTNSATVAAYLNWLVVTGLLTRTQAEAYQQQFAGGGASTCLLRTAFDDAACRNLFFNAAGELWESGHYLDLGRQTMRALIDPNDSRTDRLRYDLLDKHWDRALSVGADNGLAEVMGLHLSDSSDAGIVPYLIGDVYTIVWWADAMHKAGAALLDMQQFTVNSPEFQQRRDQLQKRMAGLIAKSQTRFDNPWGLISLFWAAGSTGASAKVAANGLLIQT